MGVDSDPILPDISTTTPDENEGATDLKHTSVERVLRLFFLGDNYCIILLWKMY
jgi:hypothetical protein